MVTGTRVRMSPESRREQLLDLGVSLLATRSLDEISIEMLAEEAGISRGLLYHYFGNKQDFHEAVVRRAADDLIAQTAPPEGGDPLDRLLASMESYLDYVVANHEGYLSLVRGASGGNARLQEIYEEARAALTDRLFTEDGGQLLADTPEHRMLVHAWTAFSEDLTLAWVRDPQDVPRERIVAAMTAALPAIVDAVS
ncbi:TetR/AcrR family transcriptional regulator [Nocardioides sp. AE5]|uniref:TetR/AcrR family transcriptional regulator n=1 Tax=Nocardioides sp. AE5 TaxID=2962573 RepID=UPI002882737E|nr:TetR/AcrR family transcriptional regulator [Nocardioides sp. AE5]MDT0203787.1 TetR/AcrR family transcriptional regulator [Nocardioides sp. AE5]